MNIFPLICAVLLASPEKIAIGDINPERDNGRELLVSGIVQECVPDDFDSRYMLLLIRDRGEKLAAFLPCEKANEFGDLLDAQVEVSGTFRSVVAGSHYFAGPMLEIGTNSEFRIVTPPKDIFSVPPASDLGHNADILAGYGRQRIQARVIAAWHGDRLLLDYGVKIGVFLAKSGKLPRAGSTIMISGYPGSDFTYINFHRAEWRLIEEMPVFSEPVDDVTPELILKGKEGRGIAYTLQGKTVRISGRVRGAKPGSDSGTCFELENGKYVFPVDIYTIPEAADLFQKGAELSVTGVVIIDIGREDSQQYFPRANGFLIVPRSADDIKILSPAPFWTFEKLRILIICLLGLLLASLIWVLLLRHLVSRRSKQLFDEQIERTVADLKVNERTRLAVELHDSISQNLTGIAYQIAAGSRALSSNPANARARLDDAERMLGACRTELKNCLFDLREDTLEMKDFSAAIRKTLEPIVGDAKITVEMEINRSQLLDSTAHAILAVIRELTANAVRHGAAGSIEIIGKKKDRYLVFTVRDNGSGFDPGAVPGPASGHYGLAGIRDRLKRLNGEFVIESSPGNGTLAVITLRTPLERSGK